MWVRRRRSVSRFISKRIQESYHLADDTILLSGEWIAQARLKDCFHGRHDAGKDEETHPNQRLISQFPVSIQVDLRAIIVERTLATQSAQSIYYPFIKWANRGNPDLRIDGAISCSSSTGEKALWERGRGSEWVEDCGTRNRN